MAITMTINGVERVISTMSLLDPAKLMDRAMLDGIGTRAVRSVKRGITSGVSPDGTAYKPVRRFGQEGQRLRDTSRLLRSITYEIRGRQLYVGSNLIYAAMQHYGGTVTPKNAKMLAIPLSRAVARAVASGGGYRAAFPGAFVLMAKSGNLFLVRKAATGRSKGKLDFLAMLRNSTKIEGTHFNDLSTQGQTEIIDFVAKRIATIAAGRA